jgi:hypothetical protein
MNRRRITWQLSDNAKAQIATMSLADRKAYAAALWNIKPNGRPLYTEAQRRILLDALLPDDTPPMTDEALLAALA